MDDKDLKIQNLIRELARWKSRAVEAATKACWECEQENCANCRIQKIKEEATRE